ncbi:MAG: acyltransferase [Paludibacteraceae bacterium]|nr:acyltransferase [Paludibacteraceae bacterium]
MKNIKKIWAKILALLYYPFKFKQFGRGSSIVSPLQIDSAKNIVIGNNVSIAHGAWLAAVPLTSNPQPELKIGDGCQIGHRNHIFATSGIFIGCEVLTADGVYITDNMHNYSNPELPILQQEIRQLNKVHIGDGSWLGENVCVIGASVGKHCVIGANAVVTHDIPDYSVAVGVPARVIKQYNIKTQKWEKISDL